MLDADQHARLPALLREIVDVDRDRVELADHLAASPVVHISWGHTVREADERRTALTSAARAEYAPGSLRGGSGPGQAGAHR